MHNGSNENINFFLCFEIRVKKKPHPHTTLVRWRNIWQLKF